MGSHARRHQLTPGVAAAPIDLNQTSPMTTHHVIEPGERIVHATNAANFQPGSVFGWASDESPTGFLSGIVVEVYHGSLSLRVRDIAPGKFPKPDRRSQRGFGAMSEERRKEVASKGAKEAHRRRAAHRFTPEEARAASLKAVAARKAAPPKPPKPDRRHLRGFASMSVEKRKAIAASGGRQAHRAGTAHEWTSEAAAVAGRKGGLAVSRDSLHMQTIGRKGGKALKKVRAAERAARNDA